MVKITLEDPRVPYILIIQRGKVNGEECGWCVKCVGDAEPVMRNPDKVPIYVLTKAEIPENAHLFLHGDVGEMMESLRAFPTIVCMFHGKEQKRRVGALSTAEMMDFAEVFTS
jgi:hypothetical protein